MDHLSEDDRAPDAVLNRYITLSPSKRARINGQVTRISDVLHDSLTGFNLN